MTLCEACGALLEVGDWPFCPHGRSRVVTISDSIPGGVILENLGPEPVRVESESHRRRLMKERGLVDCVRHVPIPGTDKSPHTTSWAGADRTTLDNAAALVDPARRQKITADSPEAQLETLVMTVTTRADGFRVRPNGEPYIP